MNDEQNQNNNPNPPMFSKATKYLGGGSIIGAALGSLIVPGVGTLVGVITGLAIGNLYLSKKDNDSKNDQDQ
jgi:phage tail tape-measure protein